MIRIDDLYIVNYCHPNCAPFQNIMRLPEEEAFALARRLPAENADTTAFYRFADFINYYPLRMQADRFLHSAFLSLGGNPKTEHPLSFVLHGSDYLLKWFGNGLIAKIPLAKIPSEYISFTYGDSSAVLRRGGTPVMVTKETLAESMRGYRGTLDEYMKEIAEKHYYIEAQLWSDDYCAGYTHLPYIQK